VAAACCHCFRFRRHSRRPTFELLERSSYGEGGESAVCLVHGSRNHLVRRPYCRLRDWRCRAIENATEEGCHCRWFGLSVISLFRSLYLADVTIQPGYDRADCLCGSVVDCTCLDFATGIVEELHSSKRCLTHFRSFVFPQARFRREGVAASLARIISTFGS
jgi:hypothetical protein